MTNRSSQDFGKHRTTFMIDKADVAELEAIAQEQRVSLAWVIRDAVKQYLSDRSLLVNVSSSPEVGRRP